MKAKYAVIGVSCSAFAEPDRPGGGHAARTQQLTAEAKMKVYMVLEHEPLEEAVQRVIDELPETPTLYATREQAEEAARKYNAEFHDPEPAVAVEVDVIEPIDRKSTKTRDARSRNRHHAGKDSQAKASSTAIRKHVGG